MVVQEVQQHLGEPHRILAVGVVPGALEDLQPTAGDRLVGLVRVLHRDDRIGVAPHDQRRQCGGEVQAVVGAHPLPRDVHDGGERRQEGAAGLGLDERAVAAPRLHRHRGGLQPDPAHQPHHSVDDVAVEGLERDRQQQVGTRQGQRPQQRVDLLAQTAGADERQALAPLGVLVGELQGDPAAERLTDHRGPLVAERDEQVAQEAGLGAEGVVALGLVGAAVARKVGGDVGDVWRQQRDGRPPHVRAARHAVHQQHHRTLAPGAVGDPVAVHGDVVEIRGRRFAHLHSLARSGPLRTEMCRTTRADRPRTASADIPAGWRS